MTAVHEVMSSAPVTVTPSTPVTDLLTLFDRHDYNAFPVLGPEGRLVGIVSKLDLLRLFVAAAPGPWNSEEGLCASDVMEREVVSADAEDDLADAGKLMVRAKLHSLPVVHTRQGDPSLVGMLSRGDVLRGLRFKLERAGGAGDCVGLLGHHDVARARKRLAFGASHELRQLRCFALGRHHIAFA